LTPKLPFATLRTIYRSKRFQPPRKTPRNAREKKIISLLRPRNLEWRVGNPPVGWWEIRACFYEKYSQLILDHCVVHCSATSRTFKIRGTLRVKSSSFTAGVHRKKQPHSSEHRLAVRDSLCSFHLQLTIKTLPASPGRGQQRSFH
jgi:hypothetical protein